jgi:uncharacterized membrane protein
MDMISTSILVGSLRAVMTILGAIVIGVSMIAFGQLLSVIREIALNTRKEETTYRTEYKALDSLATFIAVIGWIIIIGGIFIGVISSIGGVL